MVNVMIAMGLADSQIGIVSKIDLIFRSDEFQVRVSGFKRDIDIIESDSYLTQTHHCINY